MQTLSSAGNSVTFRTPKHKDIIPIAQGNKVAMWPQNCQSPTSKESIEELL